MSARGELSTRPRPFLLLSKKISLLLQWIFIFIFVIFVIFAIFVIFDLLIGGPLSPSAPQRFVTILQSRFLIFIIFVIFAIFIIFVILEAPLSPSPQKDLLLTIAICYFRPPPPLILLLSTKICYFCNDLLFSLFLMWLRSFLDISLNLGQVMRPWNLEQNGQKKRSFKSL